MLDYIHKAGQVLFGVLLDQWTKTLAASKLTLHKSIMAIPPFADFTLVHNYGAAYGIFAHQRWFLLIISISVVLFCLWHHTYLFETKWRSRATIFLLIGAIGNGIDRALLGYVIDFIDIHIIPVFNIADISINIAAACFIIDYFLTHHAYRNR